MVIRSLEAGKIIIPHRANSASGNTSVCSARAAIASRSARVPGTAEADAANALASTSILRSANIMIDTAEKISRIVHMK